MAKQPTKPKKTCTTLYHTYGIGIDLVQEGDKYSLEIYGTSTKLGQSPLPNRATGFCLDSEALSKLGSKLLIHASVAQMKTLLGGSTDGK